MAFTELQIKRLKATNTRQVVTETGVPTDLRGLQLWIYPTGSKAFMFRYKVDGRTRCINLGSYPTVSLADAHGKVMGYRVQLRQGIDPAAVQDAVRRANHTAPTVQMIFEDFRDHYLRRRRKRPAEAEAILENHILREWRDRKAASITRREIIERVRTIAEDNGPRIAEVTKGLCGQMFGCAVDMGLLESSPAVRIPSIGSRGAKRERILDDGEIKRFWDTTATIRADPQVRAALRFLLVTGQRRQEVALARWEHIDRTAQTWLIPAEHSKNGREHVVPLAPLALQVLDDLRAASRRTQGDGSVAESAFLVPSRLLEDRAVDPLAITRAVRKNVDTFGFQFTPHDLRRTAASGLAALGVSRLVVVKVLNHTDDSVTAIYDRHDYLAEKAAALNTWAAHLQATIKGQTAKVVPIARPKAARKRRASR